MLWLVETDLVAAGETQTRDDAPAAIGDRHRRRDAALGEFRGDGVTSSHIKNSACSGSPSVGWTAISSGGPAKIGQPSPALTDGSSKMSPETHGHFPRVG